MSIFNFLSRAKASALPKTYILLGPPGSGKSTQAELLARHFQLVHIDIGRELRSAAEKDTQLGREINEIINQKTDLVPDSVVVRVLSHVLEQVPKEAGVLIDGAPRRFSQIQAVEEALRTFGRSITRAIFIVLPLEVATGRIAKRFLCLGCGTPYFLDSPDALQQCSRCGGEIGQRKDDTAEGVAKRYQVFETETLPAIEHFRKEGLLVEVDGQKPSEAIFSDLVNALDSE